MPLQPKQLSEKELIVAREVAAPTFQNILHLLLRGGASCYLEFERKLLKASEVAYTTTRFKGMDGRMRFEKKMYMRANPEDVKQALRSCGVLLDTEDYKRVRLACSDPVGFILCDPFLSAVCPVGQVPNDLARMLLSALPPAMESGAGAMAAAEELTGDANFISLPEVYLDSVLRALAGLFAASPDACEPTSVTSSSEEGRRSEATFNAGAYEEALRCFTTELYPDQRVPAIAVANFIAAELLLLYGNRGVCTADFTVIATALEQRLAEAVSASVLEIAPKPAPPGPTTGSRRSHHRSAAAAPSAEAIAAATINKDRTCSMVDFSMTHTNVPRRPHRFEYYMQHDDRRDEWLRGRDEKDARKGYQKHVVGYGGHLPELQYHFGRTFHVIEEDLPNLTQPKPPLEPLAPDAFGPGRKLKATQMTEHHFTFA